MRLNEMNWDGFVPDDLETGKPEAVRWATRETRHEPDWTKWHATDGRVAFTACGRPIVPFVVDGSPEFNEITRVNCHRCKVKMQQMEQRLAEGVNL